MNDVFAIVSPCSSCSNQRSAPDPKTGAPPCPRRVWQQTYNQLSQSSDPDDQAAAIRMRHLALTGNASQDSAASLSGALTNPVYDDPGHSVLIWVAAVASNDAVRDPSTGAFVSQSILAGPSAFDTSNIQCSQRPYGPMDNESAMHQTGAFREWEPVTVHDGFTQPTQDGMATEDYPGVVRKTTLLRQAPRKDVYDHNCPEGA